MTSETTEANGRAAIRSLDDLTDALGEGGTRKCDRCRREAGMFRLSAAVRDARPGQRGLKKARANLSGVVCEGCAAEILAVVGRALGMVR